MEADSPTSYRSGRYGVKFQRRINIQAEKLLKHLLLENRTLDVLLEKYSHKQGWTRHLENTGLLFHTLLSEWWRKVFEILKKLQVRNEKEEAKYEMEFTDLLDSLLIQNPEWVHLLQFGDRPQKKEKDRLIQKMVEHLFLENPEWNEWDLSQMVYMENMLQFQRRNKEGSSEFQAEELMQSLLLKNPKLDKDGLLDILYPRRPQPQEKKDHFSNLLENLLEHLFSEYPELDAEDMLDIVFCKRYRREVLDLLQRKYNRNLLDNPDLDRDVLYLERPQEVPLEELENRVAFLLNGVLVENNPGLEKEGLLDLLYSQKYRKELNIILDFVERNSVVCEPYNLLSSSSNEILRELGKAVSLLADSQKQLREYRHLDWPNLICYPLPDTSFESEMPFLEGRWQVLVEELGSAVLHGRGAGVASSSDLKGSLEGSSEGGNVVSLLSSLGGQTLVDKEAKQSVIGPETFKNKHVLVFCINAPVLFGSDGCQSFLNLCNELYSVNLEIDMVMVARMNILADGKEVFDHLFSGFPESCLAVPYEECERREHIWKLLKGNPYEIRCSVYGSDGLFLTSFSVVHDYYGSRRYRAEAFPFTKAMLEEKGEELKALRKDSLEKLLKPPYSSEAVVYELGSPEEKNMNILEVMKKKNHIGLYVCCGGELAPRLQKLHEQCKDLFEIVVLYFPLLCHVGPSLFKKKMENWLRGQNISGWWCLPFNNSISQRLWGLTEGYKIGDSDTGKYEDKLIIVGKEGEILDMYGADVIQRIDGCAHPFTREAVVEKRKMQLQGLRFDSLLDGTLFQGDRPDSRIIVEDLLGKKIIIFMGDPRNYAAHPQAALGLINQYNRMKDEGVEFEVVFIEYPSFDGDEGEGGESIPGMPWYLVRKADGTYTQLAKKLEELVYVESLVGFGEDGRICSVKPLHDFYWESSYAEGFCLEDTLSCDISHLFGFDLYADI